MVKQLTDKETRAKQKRDLRRTSRQYVYRYLLSNPCVDCGNTDPDVLEFDHVRGQKIATITKMITNRNGLERIIAEIAKCDVRCANCHRKRHALENGHKVDLWMEDV